MQLDDCKKNDTIKDLMKKNDELAVIANKFWAIKAITEAKVDSVNCIESSTDLKILDPAYPMIKIQNFQYIDLIRFKKATEAIRKLIDFLFDESIFSGKNSTFIRKNFEDHYNLIVRFIQKKFNISMGEINKCITNKCRQIN